MTTPAPIPARIPAIGLCGPRPGPPVTAPGPAGPSRNAPGAHAPLDPTAGAARRHRKDARTMTRTDWGYAASTGLEFTRDDIVAAHFAACAEDYLAALRGVGIAPGWRVLDAGCGGGSFLPWLAEAVGPDGWLAAVDLAPENVAAAARRALPVTFRRPPDIRHGDLLALPYPDDTFDAVWCANTTQYLDDAELRRALAEMRRVVRPGGLVAVKDLDASLIAVRPGDPFAFADFFRLASAQGDGYARRLLRTRELRRHLAEAGLAEVRQRTTVIEHFAPMPAPVRRFYGLACARIAQLALAHGVRGDWHRLTDPDAPGHPLRDPLGYVSEGNTTAVGVVPPA